MNVTQTNGLLGGGSSKKLPSPSQTDLNPNFGNHQNPPVLKHISSHQQLYSMLRDFSPQQPWKVQQYYHNQQQQFQQQYRQSGVFSHNKGDYIGLSILDKISERTSMANMSGAGGKYGSD